MLLYACAYSGLTHAERWPPASTEQNKRGVYQRVRCVLVLLLKLVLLVLVSVLLSPLLRLVLTIMIRFNT